jgi:hypothetical protein
VGEGDDRGEGEGGGQRLKVHGYALSEWMGKAECQLY